MTSIPNINIRQAVPPPDWIRNKNIRDVFSSGCEELNRLTGGIPCSAIVEICGQNSSGRTALVYSILGSRLSTGHVCAYIDVTNAFDPLSAVQTEIPLRQLLWVRCSGIVKKAFLATDTVLQAGGFSLIILDLADISFEKSQKIPLSHWFRFQRTVEKQGSTLLILSKLPVTKTTAALVVDCQSPEPEWLGQHLPILSRIKSEILVKRPAPRRSSSVFLKSIFWSEQRNVRRHPFSR